MSDFTDTSSYGEYYDRSYQSTTDAAIADGTTTDLGTSADWAAGSYEASDASWAAWGNSIQADSYATEAWYAGDTEGSQYWTSVSDGYEADSHAADSASWSAWDASSDAYADESAAWSASSSYDTSYDAGAYDSGYSTYDAGSYDSTYDTSSYDTSSYDGSGY